MAHVIKIYNRKVAKKKDMITFYTSHCPRCKVLMTLMDNKKIEYEVVDDSNIYETLAEKNNIDSMPFAEIDGKVVETKELIKYINSKGE